MNRRLIIAYDIPLNRDPHRYGIVVGIEKTYETKVRAIWGPTLKGAISTVLAIIVNNHGRIYNHGGIDDHCTLLCNYNSINKFGIIEIDENGNII